MCHSRLTPWLIRFVSAGILLAMALPVVFGQNIEKKKADEMFAHLAFSPAIEHYQKALKKTNDPDCILKLAECYRLTNQYENAAVWYQKAMAIPQKPSITVFYYAHTLLQQGDFSSARKRFREYQTLAPNDPRGKNFVQALDRLEILRRDSSKYRIQNLNINTEASEFGPTLYSGNLVFASSRKGGSLVSREFEWLDQPFLDLFSASQSDPQNDSVFGTPIPLQGEINTRFHESNFIQRPGSNEGFFTRNNFLDKKKGHDNQGVVNLKLYIAELTGLEGKNIREFPYNSDDHNIGHAAFSADGSWLVFVSDQPGGQGGKDLYECRREGSGWSPPQNLGPIVNTPGDEMFPFIHPDGTLFFSSNGQPGLGYLDIFALKIREGDSIIENMGMGINSAYDDFGVWVKEEGTGGFFSSNRPGGKGDDDIYRFQRQGAEVEIIVRDKVAHLPIFGSLIEVTNPADGSSQTLVTDSLGRATFLSPLGREYLGTVNTTDFDPVSLDISTRSTTGQTFFSYLVELYNPPPAITAIVVDEDTRVKLPGAHVYFIESPGNDTLLRIADHNGRIAIKLEKTATYQLMATHPGYLAYTDVVNTTTTTYDGDTVIPLRMQKIRFNEPIVLKNIHYDFDKWFIRSDAIPDLTKLLQLLRENPGIQIELSSHTDCRGSDEYNLILSQKRAQSAKNWLVQNGIAESRILAKGYGETKMVNECDDGVDCDENKHFANRRTEFTILGNVEGVDLTHSILFTAEDPAKPPVYHPENGRSNPDFVSANLNNPVLPTLPSVEPVQMEPGKTIFRVQIGAFGEPQSEEKLKDLFEYKPFLTQYREGKYYKYAIGDYGSFAEAEEARIHLVRYGYRDAFLTGWRDGVKLLPEEIQKLR